jgi:hypothetical protein
MSCLEITQKRFEEQYHFVDDWCRKNNLISGIDKYLQDENNWRRYMGHGDRARGRSSIT